MTSIVDPAGSLNGSGAKAPRFLLIGPYDPHCGEYTFLAPPLGVWRLQGVLTGAGLHSQVFDPNCCEGSPRNALDAVLATRWDVVGISTTGMTLAWDLELAHQVRRRQPTTLLVAGGMEATFKPERMFEIGPFDLVVLGEGERPLLEIGARLGRADDLTAIAGTAALKADGTLARYPQDALDHDEHRDAIFATPYEEMPYPEYWRRLEEAYRLDALPVKAAREARLAEIRSARLITLNYCPMNCSFCSSTNFLHAAQNSNAKVRRLDAAEILQMVRRIVAAQPGVRTIIFQDDIFVFSKDERILPLCSAIVAGKKNGELPPDLQFISTNRIDAMNEERLLAMRDAGFRVLGFGIESFSLEILTEFNKHRIHPFIEPMLTKALEVGITPFLDLILTSPRCSIADLAENIRQAHRWLHAGCEVGMYPYVIPFSGAAMASDPRLEPFTIYETRNVARTGISWSQAAKIPPIDTNTRAAILAIESDYEAWIEALRPHAPHLPSRLRSLVWILSAGPVLEAAGEVSPASAEVLLEQLLERLPLREGAREDLRNKATLHTGSATATPPPSVASESGAVPIAV